MLKETPVLCERGGFVRGQCSRWPDGFKLAGGNARFGIPDRDGVASELVVIPFGVSLIGLDERKAIRSEVGEPASIRGGLVWEKQGERESQESGRECGC